MGDSGTGDGNQYMVAALLERIQPSFLLHTGDVIYNAGAYADFNPKYFTPYSRTLPSIPFFTSLGNHDVGTLNGQPYLDNFYLPSNNPLNSERYYSFDYGNAHFVALDTNQSTSPGSEMYNWVQSDLAGTTKFWKFVFFHHALYSSGPHSLDVLYLTRRNDLSPLFAQYNVDVVFAGHDHDYERTFAIRDYAPAGRGVMYIVTGGGGARRYDKIANNGWSAFFKSAFHAVKVSMGGCVLILHAIEPPLDTVFDSFVINRCPPVVYLPVIWR